MATARWRCEATFNTGFTGLIRDSQSVNESLTEKGNHNQL